MPEAAITFQDVSVKLGGRTVLDKFSCQVEKGRLTAIMGPNGTGKTTLLHAILGLLPYSGKIYFNGHGTARRPKIGYVPQDIDLDHGSPITVRDFLVAGIAHRPVWMGLEGKAKANAEDILIMVGVDNVLDAPLGKLSGGELQRILLAQALLGDPKILLLDEPTAAVDIHGEALFCELLENVHNDLHLTTLLVTHDLSFVAAHAHNVLCLNQGLICAGPTKEVLTKENLMRVFSPHSELFLRRKENRNSDGRTG